MDSKSAALVRRSGFPALPSYQRAACGAKRPAGTVQRDAMAVDWPVSRRACGGRFGHSGRRCDLFLWISRRGRVEDAECGRDVGSAVRWAADSFDWRAGGGSVEPASDLRRHGRVRHSQRSVVGRRSVQVQRRREDVGECWAARNAADQPHRGRSEECGRGLRGSAGSRLRAESRARSLQVNRRRKDVDACAR